MTQRTIKYQAVKKIFQLQDPKYSKTSLSSPLLSRQTRFSPRFHLERISCHVIHTIKPPTLPLALATMSCILYQCNLASISRPQSQSGVLIAGGLSLLQLMTAPQLIFSLLAVQPMLPPLHPGIWNDCSAHPVTVHRDFSNLHSQHPCWGNDDTRQIHGGRQSANLWSHVWHVCTAVMRIPCSREEGTMMMVTLAARTSIKFRTWL